MSNKIETIEIAQEALAMKYLSVVFENDVETVAKVLASMEEAQRDQLIDLVVGNDLNKKELKEVQSTFNAQLERLSK